MQFMRLSPWMGHEGGVAEASGRSPSMSRELMLAARKQPVNIDDQYQSENRIRYSFD
ncbi:hypothetical protein ACQ86G_14920 [Roseateles chitinivorans]|uniref:hypothetical protein n=1 Tax=Roseateles chitinivorans TaxID=2917965 RepID=UPI003D67B472